MFRTLTVPKTLDHLFEATLDSSGPFANVTGSASAFMPFRRSLTSTDEPIPPFAQLEALADLAAAEAFASAVALADETGWSPAYYVRAIRLALRAGAHRPAAELARRARERYPNDDDVQRLAGLLAPLVGPARRSPADPTVRANRNWFVYHGAAYRGQWVAVKNGELLGAAPTLRELKARVGDTRLAVISQVV